MNSQLTVRCVVVLAVALLGGSRAHAAHALCDTPVYRYALYRWTPSPYELYHFHSSADSKTAAEKEADAAAAEQVKTVLEEASRDAIQTANLAYFSIDSSDEQQLNQLPPDVRQAFEVNQERSLPDYLLVTPQGVLVFDGNLDVEQANLLLDSPARREIGKLIGQGKAGVTLLLEGKSEAANERAEQLIQDTISQLANGTLSLPSIPEDTNPDVGYVRVARDNPDEQWLIRMLHRVESDLAESEEPIVFTVFGRGRVLFSCLGNGVTAANLQRDLDFIMGACKCTVKSQNPGIDLMIRHNWDQAAATVADLFGAEEGNDQFLSEDLLFPELVIPTKTDDDENQTDEEAKTEGPVDNESAKKDAKDTEPKTEGTLTASRSETAKKKEVEQPPSYIPGLWTLVLGVGVVLSILFATTWMVLRPR